MIFCGIILIWAGYLCTTRCERRDMPKQNCRACFRIQEGVCVCVFTRGGGGGAFVLAERVMSHERVMSQVMKEMTEGMCMCTMLKFVGSINCQVSLGKSPIILRLFCQKRPDNFRSLHIVATTYYALHLYRVSQILTSKPSKYTLQKRASLSIYLSIYLSMHACMHICMYIYMKRFSFSETFFDCLFPKHFDFLANVPWLIHDATRVGVPSLESWWKLCSQRMYTHIVYVYIYMYIHIYIYIYA